MPSWRIILFFIIVLASLFLAYFFVRSDISHEQTLAASFSSDTVTIAELKEKYDQQKKVKVLVVPGHEPDFGGAQYKKLKERDLVVPLSEKITALLQADPRFEVIQTRDADNWYPELAVYFDQEWESIKAWVIAQKLEMQSLIERGQIIVPEPNPGQAAPGDVALRIYGINKWANEHDFDIAIHVHLNDYGNQVASKPNQYKGLAVYVPDPHYGNASASRAIGETVFAELNKAYPTSTQPFEKIGIVPDQELIAIGSNNTSDVASILIEYGYLYEPMFQTAASREKAFTDMAERTYRGLKTFFEK